MTYHKLQEDLRNKKYAPVYFLQGDEPFYINAIVDHLTQSVPSHAQSFDLTTLYGQDTNIATITDHAKRFPMIATHQVVIIKEAQHLQDLNRANPQATLLHYLDNPNPQTILLFTYKGKTLDQRKTFTKQLAKKALLFTSKKIQERELPGWIQNHLQAQDHHITPEAIHLLITLTGDNLQALHQQLQKVTINLPPKATITLPILRQYISRTKAFDIFDLQQAIQAHNKTRIWEVTQHFMENTKKFPLLPQITLLTNFFTKLLILHKKPHASTAQIASTLRIPPYFARSYQHALQHYSPSQTIQNLQHLHQADLQSKGINHPTTPEKNILQNLIAKILAN